MHSREKGIRMTVELDNDHGTFWSINRGLNWSRNRSVKLVPEQSQEPRSSMPNSVGCNTWNPHSLIENMLDRNDYGWSSRNRSSGQHHEHLARTHQQSYGPIWTIFKQSWNNESLKLKLGKVFVLGHEFHMETTTTYPHWNPTKWLDFSWRKSWNIVRENHHLTWNTL